MAHIVIDRRKNAKGKSTPNRKRYVDRVREHIKEAIKKTVRDSDIKDITDKNGRKISIPSKGLSHPTFHHSKKGGQRNIIYTGNKEFEEGDRINRPSSEDNGLGSGASNSDETGEDNFEFTLTREEFMDIFFEGLELPDLVKKSITKIDEWIRRRAGFSTDGNPATLNILRSARHAKMRRIGLRGQKKKQIEDLEIRLQELQDIKPITEEIKEQIFLIKENIDNLQERIKKVPFFDEIDLRYNQYQMVPVPATQAVMFCILDVSGSMDNWMKEMAKRFFMLLFLFLSRDYERVEIIFIRHHTIAKEVDEEEFFHSKETGGTIVSSALALTEEIIQARFPPTQFNVFACQASDGEDWGGDLIHTQEILKRLLKTIQYFAYVEVGHHKKTSDLWPYYEEISNTHKNFVMNFVSDISEIYPVFRALFEKR